MNKTNKILATVATVGALAFSSFVSAAPAEEAAPQPVPPCMQTPHHVGPADRVALRYEALERMLTLKDDQKSAWRAYVDARVALATPAKAYDKPAVDTQARLDRRAERAEARAAQIRTVAQSRAELLKVLSPEQKFVMEKFEFQHQGVRAGHNPHHGMMFKGPNCGGAAPHGMPCPNAECPVRK